MGFSSIRMWCDWLSWVRTAVCNSCWRGRCGGQSTVKWLAARDAVCEDEGTFLATQLLPSNSLMCRECQDSSASRTEQVNMRIYAWWGGRG